MKIGFMGGTFSPPHLGHLHSAEVFYKEAELDELLIIPAKVSPFKVETQITADDASRFEMAKLCFSELVKKGINAKVSDIELKSHTTSYTYKTIRQLKNIYPSSELYMFVGYDMFLTLEKWKNYSEIFESCHIYTRCRQKGELEKMKKAKAHYEAKYNAKVIISKDEPFTVSSTQVRKIIAQNHIKFQRNLLTDDVLRYIIENRLYFEE